MTKQTKSKPKSKTEQTKLRDILHEARADTSSTKLRELIGAVINELDNPSE
jgi:hypothetical protein